MVGFHSLPTSLSEIVGIKDILLPSTPFRYPGSQTSSCQSLNREIINPETVTPVQPNKIRSKTHLV